VLLTAGPTFEAIDPVRGITNRSTGKMGFAIARAACEAGARVTLVCGPVSQAHPMGVRRIDVGSALEMHAAVHREVADQDVFIAVAAVADYRPLRPLAQKIKKGAQTTPPAIELVQNPDILAEVAALMAPPLCVGFAAESENLHEYAESKRRSKQIPLIVGNLIDDGFGGDDNTLILFDDDGPHPLAPAPKLTLGRQLVAHIAGLLEQRR
jgi:phosphopantothenoylcysteine decarboxylase/phosphopantothenate--cysteine ligase